MPNQKRLSLSQKCAIINACNAKGSAKRGITELASEYWVNKSSIHYITQNEEKFKNMDGLPAKRYNTRTPTKNSEIEQPLLEWFYALRTENKEANGQMILQGAKKFAKKLGADVDALNESWLQRWRERHGIHYKALQAGDCHTFEEWLSGIKALLNSHEHQDIYNCDETALEEGGSPSRLPFKFQRLDDDKTLYRLARRTEEEIQKTEEALPIAGRQLPMPCRVNRKIRWHEDEAPAVMLPKTQHPVYSIVTKASSNL